MITENILQFIPQRHPFVMIDELLFADEENVRTGFTIKSEYIFFENGFFAEAGLLENIAQTIATGKGYINKKANKENGGYIAAIKNFEVFFLPKLNEVLKTEINILNTVFNMTTVAGKIFVNNKLCAQCEMKVFTNTND